MSFFTIRTDSATANQLDLKIGRFFYSCNYMRRKWVRLPFGLNTKNLKQWYPFSGQVTLPEAEKAL